MEWTFLHSPEQVDEIISLSFRTPCVIFKHSPICSISSAARRRMEAGWIYQPEEFLPFFVDVIDKREISRLIAERFRIVHQSPQMLAIRNGEAVLARSHLMVDPSALKAWNAL